MGLFRKVTSISTAGLVDFRSAKDRTAAHTKGTKKEAKKQTAIMQQQLAMQQAAAQPPMRHQAPPPTIPPGWYPSPSRPNALEWWDGWRWTQQYQSPS